MDFSALYTHQHVSTDERDRVARAEGLLAALPPKASHTKEVVDATLRAFGVDADRIVDAATKELMALEVFARAAQEHLQRVMDDGQKRLEELEAEIDHCKGVMAQARREHDERGRAVGAERERVQRVLEFFAREIDGVDVDPDEPTEVGADKKRTGSTPARK